MHRGREGGFGRDNGAPPPPPVVVVPRLGAAVGEEGEGPTTGGMSGRGGGQRIAHGGKDEK